MKIYPDEIKTFIYKNYKGVGPKQMAERISETFNKKYTHQQLKSYYANHNLNSGLNGRFNKGHKTWNKGMKGLDIGGKETRFKKGNIPSNYMPVGSERVNGDDYVDIKVADPNKWIGKHVFIWEEHNGPVPEGHAIIFGDKNRRNFDISFKGTTCNFKS